MFASVGLVLLAPELDSGRFFADVSNHFLHLPYCHGRPCRPAHGCVCVDSKRAACISNNTWYIQIILVETWSAW